MGEKWPENPIEALERLNAQGVPLTFAPGVEILLAQAERAPAPAWTREVPRVEGFYWRRRGPLGLRMVAYYRRGLWLGQDDADDVEHWPVKLEPPG